MRWAGIPRWSRTPTASRSRSPAATSSTCTSVVAICWRPTSILLTDIGADTTTNAAVMSDIYANRHSVEALNRVFDAYSDTITT